MTHSPDLINKYNYNVPRYTSYPPVPNWHDDINQEIWLDNIRSRYHEDDGISLYIHLPFCENLCTYCGCNKRITKNHAVEIPYIKAILAEWKIYTKAFGKKPVIKEIHLGGGTPTFFKPRNLKILLTNLLDTVELSKDVKMSYEVHPSSTSAEHLEVMYELGFRRISIGVQDVSPQILEAINRNQTEADVVRVTNQARDLGYESVNYDIIYGLPFQKPINIFDTINFIQRMLPDRVAFYSYAHVPWKSAGQRAFSEADVPYGNDKLALFELGSDMLLDEGYYPLGMDHFCRIDDGLFMSYLEGNMHRNFMGYTDKYTALAIGLGASAISDSWNMYTQNEKHIEQYQEIVLNGKLPIIKGHRLSINEEVVRQHILNLMCRDYTYWSSLSVDAGVMFPLLKNLRKLAEDHLVEFTSNSITVTENGKRFIRNICAAIDPNFQMHDAEEKVYSKAI